MTRAKDIIVFLGPSLSRKTAKHILKADYRPPAAQGDLWKAMRENPHIIVLIDGVFETQPSVWHHEIRSALDAGIQVFGASSMGALRAAEMADFGMVGVGTIYDKFRSGIWNDDADVALLHAPEEFDFRSMTIPFVNVRHNAERALASKVISAREAKDVLRIGRKLFYQERSWNALRNDLGKEWSPDRVAAFSSYWEKHFEDLKSRDAQNCLSMVAEFSKSPRVKPVRRSTELSAYARQRWSLGSYQERSAGQGRNALRTMAFASWARGKGVRVDALKTEQWEKQFIKKGVDPSFAHRWAEMLSLEQSALENLRQVSGGELIDEEAALMEFYLQE